MEHVNSEFGIRNAELFAFQSDLHRVLPQAIAMQASRIGRKRPIDRPYKNTHIGMIARFSYPW